MRKSAAEKAYQVAAPKLLKKEFKTWQNQWRDKSLKQICSMYHSHPFNGDECWFSQGGEKNILNSNISTYLKMRSKLQQAATQKASDNALTQIQALKPKAQQTLLTKKTGFHVYDQNYNIHQKGQPWEKAAKFCLSKNMTLPSSQQLKQNNAYLVAYNKAHNSDNEFKTYIRDEAGAIGHAKKSGKVVYSVDQSTTGTVLSCVTPSNPAKAKSKLKKQIAYKKSLTVNSPLAFWQKAVTVCGKDLSNLSDFSQNNINLGIGNAYAKFQCLQGGGRTLKNVYQPYYRYRVETSSNLFKWYFKPSASERDRYTKNLTGASSIKNYGITRAGVKQFIKHLKTQPLFQVLTNKKVSEGKYDATLSGVFKDAQGKKHTVSIIMESTGHRVNID